MSQIQPPLKAPRFPGGSAVMPQQPADIVDSSAVAPVLVLAGLVLSLILAYWDMFALTSAAWNEGLYSHGWIVPVFAVGLLWLRWQPLGSLPSNVRTIGAGLTAIAVVIGALGWYFQSNQLSLIACVPGTFGVFLAIGGPFGPVPTSERWIGLGLLAVGLAVRLWAAKYSVLPIDRLTFLPAIFGAFMLVGGLHAIRWAWPALGFLVFMFPLPTVLEVSVLNQLQRFASICSTFVLQTLGVAAMRTGNLIRIPGMEQPLTIADACSGLRMATIFGALAVAMVFLIERPWWDKFIILLSAIPIALLVNIIRITVTGLLYMALGQDNHFVTKLAHDWAGLVMMPMALGFLWLELQILERLTVPVETVQLRPVAQVRAAAAVPLR